VVVQRGLEQRLELGVVVERREVAIRLELRRAVPQLERAPRELERASPIPALGVKAREVVRDSPATSVEIVTKTTSSTSTSCAMRSSSTSPDLKSM
jgi:hypothetical protein